MRMEIFYQFILQQIQLMNIVNILVTKFKKMEFENDISLQLDDNEKFIALLFHNASKRIAREFSKEDREKLKKEWELMWKEIKRNDSINSINAKSNSCIIL